MVFIRANLKFMWPYAHNKYTKNTGNTSKISNIFSVFNAYSIDFYESLLIL